MADVNEYILTDDWTFIVVGLDEGESIPHGKISDWRWVALRRKGEILLRPYQSDPKTWRKVRSSWSAASCVLNLAAMRGMDIVRIKDLLNVDVLLLPLATLTAMGVFTGQGEMN